MTSRKSNTAPAQDVQLTVDASTATTFSSPTLFGLFLEDLNHGVDGGLNANVITNYSFDDVYLDSRTFSEVAAIFMHRHPQRLPDRTRHWRVLDASLTSESDDAVTPGAFYGRLRVTGRAQLENWGYRAERPSIAVSAGQRWTFDVLARRRDFDGELHVELVTVAGVTVASAPILVDGDGWQSARLTLVADRDADVALRFVFIGNGSIDLDEVRLTPQDHWGAGDARWSQGVMRRDLVEALRDLNPTFLRFPGGCLVEGLTLDNAYDWKRTVGPLSTRQGDYNLWALRTANGDYAQSNEIGYYEYFLLCEDLGIEPMPVVNAGLSCQPRGGECIEVSGPTFERVVRDTLDLIDWATADASTNEWAAKRAEAGHPEPFALKYLAIGNENYGQQYFEAFSAIRAAVDAHHPGLEVILSASPFIGKKLDQAWEFARTCAPGVIVDEHYYRKPKWFIEAAHRYDEYDRNGPKVFVGEYAAAPPTLMMKIPGPPPNSFESALAEAAYLTGIERNSDVVAMTSYAPLFNLVERGQWRHNLIDFNRRSVCKTANYFVQQLFGQSHGDRIVPIAGNLPNGLHASALATDSFLSIKVVSTAERPVAVTLTMPGVGNQQARVTTLAADLKARNTLTYDGLPVYAIEPAESVVNVVNDTVTITIGRQSIVRIELGTRPDTRLGVN